jgi:hypothetical protein
MDLPPDLADLERRLARRNSPPLPGELRQRVLAAVRRASDGHDFWRFAAGVAAAALLAINLSMSVANDTDWHLIDAPVPRDTGAAEQLGALLPELSPQEARRQALLMQARSRLHGTPPLPPPERGSQRWLTP